MSVTQLLKVNQGSEKSATTAGAVCPHCAREPFSLGSCREFVESAAIPIDRHVAATLVPGELFYCSYCGLGFREPFLSDTQALDVYRSIPLKHWQYQQDMPCAWTIVMQKLSANGSRYQKGSPLVLDVGCFDGQFLRQLPDAWQKYAVEPNQEAVERLAEMSVVTLGASTGDALPTHAGKFDVVTLFDVFEHVSHPWELLQDCVALLKPGGSLFVSTGNCRHWTWRALGGTHPYLESYRHIRFASPRFFQAWAQDNRFQLVNCEPISHKPKPLLRRWNESCEVIYFRGREQGGWLRLWVRLLNRLPNTRRWMHKRHARTITALRDHLLVEIRRPFAEDTA